MTGTIATNLNYWQNGSPNRSDDPVGAAAISGTDKTAPAIKADVWLTDLSETAPFNQADFSTYGFQPSTTTAYTSKNLQYTPSNSPVDVPLQNAINVTPSGWALNVEGNSFGDIDGESNTVNINKPLTLIGNVTTPPTFVNPTNVLGAALLLVTANNVTIDGFGFNIIQAPGLLYGIRSTTNYNNLTITDCIFTAMAVGTNQATSAGISLDNATNVPRIVTLLNNQISSSSRRLGVGISIRNASVRMGGSTNPINAFTGIQLTNPQAGSYIRKHQIIATTGINLIEPVADITIGGIVTDGNTFTPLTTAFTHIAADIDATSPGASTTTIEGNTFNGIGSVTNGRAIEIIGTSAANFGNVVLGGTTPNDFGLNHTYFIALPPGSSPGALTINAANNRFDVGAGLQLPSVMTEASLFNLEDQIGHKMDISVPTPTAGLVNVIPSHLFVTGKAAVSPFAANNEIQRPITIYGPLVDGLTLHIKAGTYTNGATIASNTTFLPQATTSITTLTVNGAGKALTLAGPLTLSTGLALTNGHIGLGSSDLTYNGTAANLTGGSLLSHIITGTPYTGRFVLGSMAANATRIFPVGRDAASYTPVKITPATGASFGVRAVDITVSAVVPNGNPVNGYNGTDPASLSNHAVKTIWFIDRISGTSANVEFNWNATVDEQGAFNRNNSFASRYTGTEWQRFIGSIGPASDLDGAGPGTIYAKYITTDAFSPFAVADESSPLPVNLVDFQATRQQEDVVVSWITDLEKDNAYFSVERSSDGSAFSEIGKVDGKGNSTQLNTYRFVDNQAKNAGVNTLYYRLKQTDFNGTTVYSNIRSVVLDGVTQAVVEVFPNPAYQQVTVKAIGTNQLTIRNANGVTILRRAFNSNTSVELNQLPAGIYLFQVFDGSRYTTQKVVIADK